MMTDKKWNPQTTLQALSAFLSYHDKEDYDGVFIVARQRDEIFQIFCGGTADDPDYADDWRAVQYLAETTFEDLAAYAEPEKPKLQVIEGGEAKEKDLVPRTGIDMRKEFAKRMGKIAPPNIEKSRHIHPRPDDKGDMVTIYHPSVPSSLSAFSDPAKLAVVLPDEPTPASIYGIPFEPWKSVPRSLAEWIHVEGQAKLDEPPDKFTKNKKRAAGAVIMEPDGRYWVVAPTNAYGGYKATFPKGTVEAGLSHQATAIREAYEEAGLQIEITGFIGDFERTTSVTRYYFARRVGGTPSDMGWESQAVMLVPQERLLTTLNHAKDHELIHKILALAEKTPQTILNAGCEGGCIELVGLKSGRSWKYQLGTNEIAMRGFLDQKDWIEPSGKPERAWVKTWTGALKLLDQKSWQRFHPITVHPAFRGKIRDALKARLGPDDEESWENWLRVLED